MFIWSPSWTLKQVSTTTTNFSGAPMHSERPKTQHPGSSKNRDKPSPSQTIFWNLTRIQLQSHLESDKNLFRIWLEPQLEIKCFTTCFSGVRFPTALMPTMCLSNSELLENVILHVLQVNLVLLEGSALAKLDSILITFLWNFLLQPL